MNFNKVSICQILVCLGCFGRFLKSGLLNSQTFVLPQSASQIQELRTSLAVVASACVGVIVIAFSARHYLPKAPLLNRMMLEPLQDEQRETLDQKGKTDQLDAIRTRLDDCVSRLPSPDAYEYQLLKGRGSKHSEKTLDY